MAESSREDSVTHGCHQGAGVTLSSNQASFLYFTQYFNKKPLQFF